MRRVIVALATLVLLVSYYPGFARPRTSDRLRCVMDTDCPANPCEATAPGSTCPQRYCDKSQPTCGKLLCRGVCIPDPCRVGIGREGVDCESAAALGDGGGTVDGVRKMLLAMPRADRDSYPKLLKERMIEAAFRNNRQKLEDAYPNTNPSGAPIVECKSDADCSPRYCWKPRFSYFNNIPIRNFSGICVTDPCIWALPSFNGLGCEAVLRTGFRREARTVDDVRKDLLTNGAWFANGKFDGQVREAIQAAEEAARVAQEKARIAREERERIAREEEERSRIEARRAEERRWEAEAREKEAARQREHEETLAAIRDSVPRHTYNCQIKCSYWLEFWGKGWERYRIEATSLSAAEVRTRDIFWSNFPKHRHPDGQGIHLECNRVD